MVNISCFLFCHNSVYYAILVPLLFWGGEWLQKINAFSIAPTQGELERDKFYPHTRANAYAIKPQT